MLEVFSISFIILLGVISPGPDFTLTVRNALLYSSTTGVLSALGIAVGSLLHAAYSVIGVTVLIAQSPVLFTVIKYLGAGYLIYLGLKGLFHRSKIHSHESSPALALISARQAFVQGFLCNALNPKAMLFFLALFTLVLDIHTVWWVKLLYGLEIGFIHLLWFALIAILIGHRAVRAKLQRVQQVITRLMGGFLIYFGSRIAFL